MQFLMGAALLVQNGEVYAMHYLETALSSHMRALLSSEGLRFLRLSSRATWDMLNAAAVGGFRASVIKALSSDPVFTLGAHLQIEGPDSSALRARLDVTLASAGIVHRGIAPAGPTARAPPAGVLPVDDDDAASVIDTEDGHQSDGERLSAGDATPQPPERTHITGDEREAIAEALRAVPKMAPPVQSLARGNVGNDSVVW
jgi:hypothetical protein